jgi:hypothetical protein
MALNISDLNSAGSDLFADTDSFLSDLQETEATSVYGGGKSKKGGNGGTFIFINNGYGGFGGYGGGGYGRGYGGRGHGGHGHRGGYCY